MCVCVCVCVCVVLCCCFCYSHVYFNPCLCVHCQLYVKCITIFISVYMCVLLYILLFSTFCHRTGAYQTSIVIIILVSTGRMLGLTQNVCCVKSSMSGLLLAIMIFLT